VANIVNIVNMIRHSLSTTIAANFQSLAMSLHSSSLRSCIFDLMVIHLLLIKEKESVKLERRRQGKQLKIVNDYS